MSKPARIASVDSERAESVGGFLGEHLTLRPDELVSTETLAQAKRMATFWMLVIAVCHRTAGWRGRVAGVEWIGSDFLIAAARRHYANNPLAFDAERAQRLTADELAAVFSDDDGLSPIDRVDERLRLWHDTAASLTADWKGDANHLYEYAQGRVSSTAAAPEQTATREQDAIPDHTAAVPGLHQLLARFEAYSDPVRKKSNLLLMILERSGAWPLKDADLLEVAVDCHVTRVALRLGLVKVSFEVVQLLSDGAPMAESEDIRLRHVVGEACSLVVRAARPMPVMAVDNALWSVGRGCCAAEQAFCDDCGGRQAPLLKRFELEGTREGVVKGCVLAPVCRGAADRITRDLREPGVETHYH